jgi:two-component system sensor kinase
MLRVRTEQLENANKELESFAYSVSHDLRAPLRAIDGFSNMLLIDIGDRLDADSKRKFNIIRKNTKKMGQLIDDILNFSRTGRAFLSKAPIDVESIVRDVWREIRDGNPDRKMELKMTQLPAAIGDRSLVRQVLSNVLGNAVKFTRERENTLIEVSGSNSGTLNMYCVRDNGTGFDMQYYDKLFEIFRRLHSEKDYEGTGVGLAIVKKIIDKHGGQVWAESSPGEGASFYFTLPAGE